MNERANERTNERTNERVTNERTYLVSGWYNPRWMTRINWIETPWTTAYNCRDSNNEQPCALLFRAFTSFHHSITPSANQSTNQINKSIVQSPSCVRLPVHSIHSSRPSTYSTQFGITNRAMGKRTCTRTPQTTTTHLALQVVLHGQFHNQLYNRWNDQPRGHQCHVSGGKTKKRATAQHTAAHHTTPHHTTPPTPRTGGTTKQTADQLVGCLLVCFSDRHARL